MINNCNNPYKLPNILFDKVNSEYESDLLYNLLIKERINVFLTGNGGCVDSETEFLSMNGWKKISEYKPFDSVAEFIIGTETLEFNRPTKYIKFDSKEPFKHVTTVNGLTMLLTDEHKILYNKMNTKEYYSCFLKEINEQKIITPSEMSIPTRFNNRNVPQRCLKNNNIEFEYCAFIVKLFGLTLFDDDKYKTIVIHKEYEQTLKELLPTIMETANITRIFDTLTIKLDRQVYEIISHTQVYGLTDVTLRKLYTIIEKFTNFEESGVIMLDCPESADEVQFVVKSSSDFDVDIVNETFVVIRTGNNINNTIDSVLFEESEEVSTKYCFTTRSGYWVARRNGKIFITGNSGKTYLTKNLMQKFDEEELTYGITASTGVAAKNMDDKGSTINKFLGLGVLSSINFYYKKKFFNEQELRSKISSLDVLIIDEISMNSAEFLDIIFLHLKEFGFTGKILLVGDFLQLPPVMDEDLINHNYYLAFQSRSWNFMTVFLDRMKRTTDEVYTRHLNTARSGYCTNEFLHYLYDKSLDNPRNIHITEESLGDEYTKLFATNKEASVVNQRCLDLIPEELNTFEGFWMENTSFVYYRGDKDRDIKRNQNMETLLVSEKVEFKLSEKVMLVVNDKDDRFHNGDTGTITAISSYFDSKLKINLPVVTIETKTGKMITVKPHEFKFEEVIGKSYEHIDSFYQLPIIPAYAITIHKSQGLSIEKVFIDFQRFFTYSQAYVALSRVIHPDNLYVRNVQPHKFMAIPQAVWFYANIYDINNNIYNYFYNIK